MECSDGGRQQYRQPQSGNVTYEEMTRFVDYTLTGRNNAETNTIDDSFVEAWLDRRASSTDTMQLIRRTVQGLEYTKTVKAPQQRQQRQLLRRETTGTTSTTTFNRTLAILEDDTRIVVSQTPVGNIASVAHLEYGSRLVGGCTGVVISTTSILTAAHCIYHVPSQRYTSHARVAPGQYRKDDNKVYPHGAFVVDYVDFVADYKDKGVSMWDFAVVTYQAAQESNENDCSLYPGRVVTPSRLGRAQAAGGRVVGYSGDYPDGTLLDSGVCDDWDLSSNRVAYHTCDTTAGNSGSPVYVGDTVVGIHAFTIGSRNGAVMLDSFALNQVQQWATSKEVNDECVEDDVNPQPDEGGSPFVCEESLLRFLACK